MFRLHKFGHFSFVCWFENEKKMLITNKAVRCGRRALKHRKKMTRSRRNRTRDRNRREIQKGIALERERETKKKMG